MVKANIERGKKWSDIRKKYEFESRSKDVEWIDKQKSIVDDIKAYKDSIKPIEETKSKVKK